MPTDNSQNTTNPGTTQPNPVPINPVPNQPSAPQDIFVNPSIATPQANFTRESAQIPPEMSYLPIQTQPIQPVQPPNEPEPGKKKNSVFVILAVAGGVIFLIFLVLLGVKFGLPLIQSQREITLTWWGLWEDEDAIKPLIEEYQQKNPKTKIQYVRNSQQDYRERLVSSLAKGTGPDIFRFHNSWVPMFKSQLSTLPTTVMSAQEYAQSFYPIMVSDLTTTSGIVGIPLEYDGLGLFVNDSIFSNNGLIPPSTWDDVRTLAKDARLTRKDEQGVILSSAIALGRADNVDHWPEIVALMMLQNGTNLSKPADDLGQGALTFYSRFSSVDQVWDASLPPSTIAFATGKTAMYFGPSWEAFEIRQKNPTLKFHVVPLPQLPKDTPDQPDVSYATYWVEGVWTRSKNTEEAWKFLKFLSSKESLEKLYTNESKTRDFGEPYPRPDMADLLKDHPILGSIIKQAPFAKSWYLAHRTFDGPTGINSQINKYFEDAVNTAASGGDVVGALSTVQNGVAQVLGQYGLRQ